MSAVVNGHLDIVKHLATVPGVDFNTKNNEGSTLVDVARDMKHEVIAKFLLEKLKSEKSRKVLRKRVTCWEERDRDSGQCCGRLTSSSLNTGSRWYIHHKSKRRRRKWTVYYGTCWRKWQVHTFLAVMKG